MARRTAAGDARRTRGVALLMVLLAVALLALATTLPLRVESQRLQRERELELLFAGRAIRAAIESYRAASPGAVKQYPASLDDLLLDRRFPAPRRHLRRPYRDPFADPARDGTGWVLIREQGALVGVASRSERAPVLRAGFSREEAAFADAARLADWHFVHREGGAAAGAGAPAPSPSPAPPDAPAAPSPGAQPVPPGRRAECLQQFSNALQACLSAPAPDCRTQARERLRACLA